MKNTKSVSKKSASKSTKPVTKSNVVNIFAKALTVACPDKRCAAKVGKPCVHVHYHKGERRAKPHRVRMNVVKLPVSKVAPKKVVLKVKAKVQPIKTKKSA